MKSSEMFGQPAKAEVVNLETLAQALLASWDASTSYGGVVEAGNPPLGQCYPTSRVVQWFYPNYEIVRGEVWTGSALETHFWNVCVEDPRASPIDLSWSQFPQGSEIRGFEILDRNDLGDSPPTVARVTRLLSRVIAYLAKR